MAATHGAAFDWPCNRAFLAIESASEAKPDGIGTAGAVRVWTQPAPDRGDTGHLEKGRTLNSRILRVSQVWLPILCIALAVAAFFTSSTAQPTGSADPAAAVSSESASGHTETSTAGTSHHAPADVDYWPLLFVFLLSTFIGVGVIQRVSRLLHTPLMSITNAISAIAVIGSILVTGSDYPLQIRVMGAIALFASTTNIVSGFLITDRMLKMFKTSGKGGAA